jgi:Fe-S-cluster containining protein
MIIEKDINKIRRLAKQKEGENYKFRSFLKGCDMGRIDVIVHRLYRAISSKIDCKTCGNCCKKVLPVLNKKDIKRLTNGLKISVDIFKDKYLIEKENNGGITFNKKPCPFLNSKICSQYKYRPEDCRSYPHLHKKYFVSRLINVIENTSICLIVFNVYEALKEEVWNNTEFDDFNDFV